MAGRGGIYHSPSLHSGPAYPKLIENCISTAGVCGLIPPSPAKELTYSWCWCDVYEQSFYQTAYLLRSECNIVWPIVFDVCCSFLKVSIGCPERMEPITKVSLIPSSRWALSCSLCREHTGTCIQVSTHTRAHACTHGHCWNEMTTATHKPRSQHTLVHMHVYL